ncbi:hypothetical protein SCHPADRAFT_941997 [Schizopora paradoxa]|uniref:Mid2 domain-containing protein n=1 Tax=Schizopora paradoxa TaxID=27342 RepID=A0A0H2RPX7_9AGAM|nr:hypothetical protein SCHPADRAFT_941997 [Schizopora paradoxa]
MSKLVIYNPNSTVTSIGTQNEPLTPVMVTTSTRSKSSSTSSSLSGSSSTGSSIGSTSSSIPSTTNSPTSFPAFNSAPSNAANSTASHTPQGLTTTSTSPGATSTSTGGSPASSALAGSGSAPNHKAVAIALGIVIPLVVLAAIFAIIMHRRRVRRNHQTAIDGMTIVPPTLELPSPVERRRPGSHVLSWLSLPSWRASVGGTTAMRPAFKSGVSQASGVEEKGTQQDERLDSPRDIPQYVSGDWRFTNSNANEIKDTGNAERDRLVLVNGRLALWTDHSQHT